MDDVGGGENFINIYSFYQYCVGVNSSVSGDGKFKIKKLLDGTSWREGGK